MNRYQPIFKEYAVATDPWKSLRDEYYKKNIQVDVYNNHNNISSISLISIPKEERGKGIAKEIMKKICNKADALNLILSLSPTNEFGSSKSRLISFYKDFGFVMNSGRNKNYKVSDTMLRLPK